jgi:hypothetical protein
MSKSGADKVWRESGYVTAREVADALGIDLANVHRALDEGRYPGKAVSSPGSRYRRRYVDIHALIKGLAADGANSGAIVERLKLVAKDVPEAKPDKPRRKPQTRASA